MIANRNGRSWPSSRVDGAGGHLESDLQRRLRRGAQCLADLDDVAHAEQVGEGGAQQLLAAHPAGRRDGRDRVVLAGGGLLHRRQHVLLLAGAQLVEGREHPQGLRGAAQHPRDVPARAQHPRQPRPDGVTVAQQAQVPGRAAEVVGEPPVGQQPGVGVRRVGEIVEQDGQQGPLQGRAPAQSGGQGVDVAQRGGRVGEPERGQPAAGLGRGQPQVGRRHPRDRLEQRAVEQLLVQPADLAHVPAPLGDEHVPRVAAVVGAVAEGPGQPGELVGVLGQHVRAAQAAQLQPVLDSPQEPVRVDQRRRVGPPDVPTLAQRVQRRQRLRDAQRLVSPAVDELQQLHRELDVAQAAAAQFDVALGDPGRDVLDDPPAHRPHVGDEPGALGGRPHHRGDDIAVGGAERSVPGDRSRLEQRLELPRAGPAGVVRLVAGQRADERPVLSLGPQIGVDLPRDRPADPHGQPGQRGGGGQAAFGVGSAVGVGLGLGDEHDVDVGDVVELPGAGLAHRDDREPAPRRVGRQPRPGDRQGRLQGVTGQVGQHLGHDAQVEVAGQVTPGNGDHLAPVRAAQGGHRVRRTGGGRQTCGRARGVEVPDEHPPVRRMPAQVRRELRGRAEDRQQPRAQLRTVRQPRPQLGAGGRPRHGGERLECRVGIGRAPERRDQHRAGVGRGLVGRRVPPAQRRRGEQFGGPGAGR